MFNNKVVVIAVAIIIVAIALFMIPTTCSSTTEGFHTYDGYYKKYCSSCGWRSRFSCSKCTNCGYGVTASGYGECVPGDSRGPYFRDDFTYWEYGDPYTDYPFSNLYPVVKVSNMYPQYRWNVRKPWRQNRWRRDKVLRK